MSGQTKKMTTLNKILLVFFVFMFIFALAGGVVSLMSIKRDISAGPTLDSEDTPIEESEDTKNQSALMCFNEGVQRKSVEKPPLADITASAQNNIGGVVIEATSRRVLVNENMNARCYPASTTKVLTALVVLDNLDLNLPVQIPKEAEGVEGSSIYLRAGEKLTVNELLLGLMLRSGNDSAVALAMATAGTVDNFAKLMNQKAKECGANNSNFVNPHGLHDDNHYTTAYDLAMITACAYDNPEFRRIVSTKMTKIKGHETDYRFLSNKNKLLRMFNGANGVKTGYTKKSGRCLVGGAMQDGMQLISVVLNYNNMWNDTMRMMNQAFNSYYMCPIDNAILLKDATKEFEIKAKRNSKGEYEPYAYPLRRDGSESVKVA